VSSNRQALWFWGSHYTQEIKPPHVLDPDIILMDRQRWQAEERAAKPARAQLAADDATEVDAFRTRHCDRRVSAEEIAEHLKGQRGKRRGDSRLARKLSAYLKK
jgi:hypothetical protein